MGKKRFSAFILLAALMLISTACHASEAAQDERLAPGSVGHVTLSAAFVLDQTPFYLTSEGELYAYRDAASQLVYTFPTSLVFQCMELNCLVFLSDGSLSLWTAEGGCTSLAVSDSLDGFVLQGVAGTYALCQNQGSFMSIDLSGGAAVRLDAAGGSFLAGSGKNAYLYEQGVAVTAVDCASGSVLYSLDWADESDIVSACVYQDAVFFVLFNGSMFRADQQLSELERVDLQTHHDGSHYTKIAIASDGENLILVGHSQNTKLAVFQVELASLACTCVDVREGHYSVPATCKAVLRDGVYGYAITTEPVSGFVCGTLGSNIP